MISVIELIKPMGLKAENDQITKTQNQHDIVSPPLIPLSPPLRRLYQKFPLLC